MGAIFKGEKNHRFGKVASNAKPVIKYDLGGKELGRFPSAKAAADTIKDVGSNVTRCCLGKYGVCKGYIFRFEKYSKQETDSLNKNLKERHRVYASDGSWKVSETVKQNLSQKTKGRKGVQPSLQTRLLMSQLKKGVKSGIYKKREVKNVG